MSSPTIASSTPASPRPAIKEWIQEFDFWFSDGDIILGVMSVVDPHTMHVFRIHQAVLELNSPVLRTKFSDSNYPKGFLDGVQAIWMPQTSPQTMRYFLRFLYNPDTQVPVGVLINTGLCDDFLKLCIRINARTTCAPMIRRLHSIWPSSLSAWDTTDDYILASAQRCPRMGVNSLGGNIMLFHDDMFPEPASAICLARSYNIRIILPAALYHLSRIDPSSDYYKMHKEPTRFNVDSQQRLNAGLRSARWALLTTKDHHALAAFKDYVQSCLNKLTTEPSPHQECKSRMEEIYLDIVRSSMATRDVLRELKLGFDEPQRICSSCITHGRKVTSSMRQDIWNQLAVVLEL